MFETTKKYKLLFFFLHEADEPLQVLRNIVVIASMLSK